MPPIEIKKSSQQIEQLLGDKQISCSWLIAQQNSEKRDSKPLMQKPFNRAVACVACSTEVRVQSSDLGSHGFSETVTVYKNPVNSTRCPALRTLFEL